MPVTWNSISLSGIQPVDQTKSSTEQNNRQGQQSFLHPGKFYQATVNSQMQGGRFVLKIGGHNFLAESKSSLQVGKKLDIQVISTTPKLELQIVSNSKSLTQDIGRSIFLLNQPQNLSQITTSLLQQTDPKIQLSSTTKLIFQQFSKLGDVVSGTDNNGRILQQGIHRLGLNLEKLLAENKQTAAIQTLKSSLLEAKGLFSSDKDFNGKIGQLLNTLELFQLLQVRFDFDSQFFIPLPFLDQGYILIESNEKQSTSNTTDEDNWKYTLNLKMQSLGSLRIEINQQDEQLDINFFCEDREKAKFLLGYKKELQNQVSLFKLGSVNFMQGAQDPVSELLRKIVHSEHGVINTTI